MTGKLLFAFGPLLAVLFCEVHRKYGWSGTLVLGGCLTLAVGLVDDLLRRF